MRTVVALRVVSRRAARTLARCSISNLPSQFASMAGPSIAGVMLHSVWIGAMLEVAATLQFINAALYWTFFRRTKPPEEQPDEGSVA